VHSEINSTPLLEINELHKAFNMPVLKGVNLTIGRGEVHALVGENGAGKSTLSSILAGLLKPDKGQLRLNNQRYSPKRPRQAFASGVSLVAQELSIIPTLTVGENISLRLLPNKYGMVNLSQANDKARKLLVLLGLDYISPECLADSLTLGETQLVEIAKALLMPCDLLILDEPTAALTAQQADKVHSIIQQLTETGTSVIYISHRLEDVREVCDHISILRDGAVVKSAPKKQLNVDEMIFHMSGSEPVKRASSTLKKIGSTLLSATNITTKNLNQPLDIICSRSEIIGIAGLAGSGRTELLDALYGLTKLSSGSIEVDVDGLPVKIQSTRDSVRVGVGYLPKERKTQGIFSSQTIAMNTTLPSLKKMSGNVGIFSRAAESDIARAWIKKLSVKCQGPLQHIDKLSGGNQQKVLIGRWLQCDSQMLLLDEPTRGVDVGAKSAIHELLRGMALEGKSILVASSEIEELMTLCDRIIVLSNKKYVTSYNRDQWTYSAILESAFSEYQ